MPTEQDILKEINKTVTLEFEKKLLNPCGFQRTLSQKPAPPVLIKVEEWTTASIEPIKICHTS